MKTMAKKNYEEIAEAFKHKSWVKQVHYAQRGFENYGKKDHRHSAEGMKLYTALKELDSLAFVVANNLCENDNFDRDTFLKACGMQNDGVNGWSFIPRKDYIEHFRVG